MKNIIIERLNTQDILIRDIRTGESEIYHIGELR